MADDGFSFEFTCRRSGNCCSIPGGFVRVSGEDVSALALHLGLDDEAFALRYLTPSRDRLIDGPDSRCVFLEDGARTSCRVYPVRPRRCETWPYWEDLRDDPEAQRRAARRCPGIALADPHARSL